MDPREIARMITDHPDILNEDWKELGIADPGIEDPIKDAIDRWSDAVYAMLEDKLQNLFGGEPDREFIQKTHDEIISELSTLLNKGVIHYKNSEDIEKMLLNAVETAIWNR
jgi:hypothetical protein